MSNVETVNILILSKNCDNKIMQPITIMIGTWRSWKETNSAEHLAKQYI